MAKNTEFSGEAMVDTSESTIEIPHPKYPKFITELRVLDPIEALDLFSGFQKYQRVIVLQDPKTGEILYDEETKEPKTVVLNNVPAKEMVSVLEKVIKGWRGLRGSDGKEIPFSAGNMKYLFSKNLNVPKTRKVKENGIEKNVEGVQTYADYLQERVNDMMKDEEESDPKTKG